MDSGMFHQGDRDTKTDMDDMQLLTMILHIEKLGNIHVAAVIRYRSHLFAKEVPRQLQCNMACLARQSGKDAFEQVQWQEEEEQWQWQWQEWLILRISLSMKPRESELPQTRATISC